MSKYRDSRPEAEVYTDQVTGDVSGVAWDYARLMYGDSAVDEKSSEIQELIGEDEVTRTEFFEKLKPEIDEMLTQ